MATIQEIDSSINILRALLWRNNKAVNVEALLTFKQEWNDENHRDFWDNWFDDVFNLKTANTFGLGLWSILLGIPLTIEAAPPSEDNSNFGYGEFRKNYNNGNYTAASGEIILSPEQARLVLRLRYYQLTSRPTTPQINFIMNDIFGDLGVVYALDGLDMTMTYVFLFTPAQAIRLILDKYDLLPRPSTVELKITFDPNSKFGYGSFRKNYNNGNYRN